jgi:hypothetical protein
MGNPRRELTVSGRLFGLAAVAATLLAAGAAAAEVRPYTFDIPDGAAVGFEIEFEVEHPGVLEIQADWSGSRVLAFRLERSPGRNQKARRTGPSPQNLRVDVHPWDLGGDASWLLSIRALAGRGAGSGTITLLLPEDPALTARREEASVPPPPAPPPPQPWAVPRRPPADASDQVLLLFEKVEAFRGQAVGADGLPGPDACRWQTDALLYMTDWRDRLTNEGEIPPISSRRYFERLVKAIREVEALRGSDDPLLAGPPPEAGIKLKAWLAVRRQRIEPLEEGLDALFETVQNGHAPELQEQSWPSRLISCVTACERHFEQRARVGEEQAMNAELARLQWDRILAAGDALEAMVYLTVPGTERDPDSVSLARD